jgi:hypothetical protein
MAAERSERPPGRRVGGVRCVRWLEREDEADGQALRCDRE